MNNGAAVSAAAAAWPAVVWDVPMLRGLDARARAEIEAAGAVRRLRAGDVVYKHGDPADALFVVASGSCVLIGVRRGEAEAALIRRAKPGDVFGDEAVVATFSTRQLEARCESEAIVAEVPLVVLKRAASRAGGAPLMAKLERVLRRAATLDLFRTTSFTRNLPDADLEVLLDAAKHVHVARGDHVYREGDEAADAFLVADGLLSAQTDDEGKPRVEAYLSRGDVFGDEELAEREPRSLAVVANGPTWLIAIPRDVFVIVARRNVGRLDHARRLRSEGAAAEKKLRGVGTQMTTAHVFRDLYRMRVARSLLVIDQDSCIRCGHCAWSCADVHNDGVSRLVRRGDKIVVSTETSLAAISAQQLGGIWSMDMKVSEAAKAPLLVPNSCQHCKNPSCMIDCPTGAIGRNARGEVFIREDLCTGCGSCAKACPWENIQMAPRKDALPFPAVAVKCDLCEGVDGGPACVASCPVQAIARIDPNAALAELQLPIFNAKTLLKGAATGAGTAEPPAVLPVRVPAWPWVLGASLAAIAVATISIGAWTSGILSGVLIALLVGYAGGKRLRGPRAVQRWRGRVPVARYLYVAHISLGVFALGVVASHVGGRFPPNAAGALTIALVLTVLTGALGAFFATVVPRALSRVERKSVLPEELAARPKEIDEKIFSTLSGKSELVKTLFVKSLRPYRRARLGPLTLLLSRRSLREEERALLARLHVLTGGKKKGESVLGVDDLVRLVVEHRAVRLQRMLTWLLRGWLVPHLGATAAAVILLLLHVVAVVRIDHPTVTITKAPTATPAISASALGRERSR